MFQLFIVDLIISYSTTLSILNIKPYNTLNSLSRLRLQLHKPITFFIICFFYYCYNIFQIK